MDVNEQEGDAFSDISNQIWVIWDAENFSNWSGLFGTATGTPVPRRWTSVPNIL